MPGGTSQDLPPVSPKTKKNSHYHKLQVCSNFISGNCDLGENCSLPHPDPFVVVDNNTVTICYDNLKGLCDRENCKYYHPTEKVKEKMETFGTKMSPSVMWNKTNGNNPSVLTISTGPHSPISTVTPSPPLQASPIPPAYYVYQQQWQPGPYFSRYRYDKSDRLPVCRDFIKGQCSRTDEECKYAHPGDEIIFDERDSTVIVCMDFIKGSCTRPFCKYLHPPVHLQEFVRNRQNKSYTGSYYPLPNSPGPLIPTVVPQQGYQLQGSSYFVNQPQTVYPQYQQVYMPVSSYPMYAPYPAMQAQSMQWVPNVHPLQTGPMMSTVVPPIAEGGDHPPITGTHAAIQPAVDHMRE